MWVVWCVKCGLWCLVCVCGVVCVACGAGSARYVVCGV